jgi:hypothetical protein
LTDLGGMNMNEPYLFDWILKKCDIGLKKEKLPLKAVLLQRPLSYHSILQFLQAPDHS